MQINLDDLLPNSRYSKLDNKAQTNSTPLQTSSKAPKREALKSVPMINNIGDENSFFNAIIHMLYFTPEILTFLQENKDNFNIENSGYAILGELYNILDKYDRLLDKEKCYLIPEEERFLDVKNLRQKISELYKGEGFFQMNNYEDPSEILYFFLNAIHSYSMSLKLPKYYIIENRKSEKDLLNENNDYDFLNEREDKCDPKCLSHTLFDIHLIQQTECENCKGSGKIKQFPKNFYIFDINYKNISISTMHLNKFKYILNIFFRQARKQIQFTDDECPNKCKEPKVINRTYVMESSQYLVFNINWKEIKPTLQEVCKCYFMIPRVFYNNEIFDIIDRDALCIYDLYGFISYWNGHYICFYTNKNKDWYFYEDMNTKKIGLWKDVLVFCIKNHYHPIMLFYRKQDSRIAIFDEKIVEKDFDEIMDYCKAVDEEILKRKALMSSEDNKISNLTESINSSMIRPIMQPNKSNDYDLLKTVENLQKLEDMKEKNKKKKHMDDTQQSDTASGMIPEGINIFAGKWICHKCHNHNNFSIYQCSKCQEINTKVFEIIYNAKTQRGAYRRNFKNNPSKFEKLSKNFEQKYSNLIKSKLNLSQRDDAYRRIKKMQEEEEKKLELERLRKLNENKIKFIVNPDKTWTCIYCGFFNEDINIDFCENCKWNKPKENEYVEKIKDIETISSLKQYL